MPKDNNLSSSTANKRHPVNRERKVTSYKAVITKSQYTANIPLHKVKFISEVSRPPIGVRPILPHVDNAEQQVIMKNHEANRVTTISNSNSSNISQIEQQILEKCSLAYNIMLLAAKGCTDLSTAPLLSLLQNPDFWRTLGGAPYNFLNINNNELNIDQKSTLEPKMPNSASFFPSKSPKYTEADDCSSKSALCSPILNFELSDFINPNFADSTFTDSNERDTNSCSTSQTSPILISSESEDITSDNDEWLDSLITSPQFS